VIEVIAHSVPVMSRSGAKWYLMRHEIIRHRATASFRGVKQAALAALAAADMQTIGASGIIPKEPSLFSLIPNPLVCICIPQYLL
jgi:hypothetical protein